MQWRHKTNMKWAAEVLLLYFLRNVVGQACSGGECANDGRCIPTLLTSEGYICDCALPFTGKQCKQGITDCEDCYRKTACMVVTSKDIVCICDSGDLCQIGGVSSKMFRNLGAKDVEIPVFSNVSLQISTEVLYGLAVCGIFIAVLGLFVCIVAGLCRLAISQRKSILKKYNAVVKSGEIPTALPPDSYELFWDTVVRLMCCRHSSIVTVFDENTSQKMAAEINTNRKKEEVLKKLLSTDPSKKKGPKRK